MTYLEQKKAKETLTRVQEELEALLVDLREQGASDRAIEHLSEGIDEIAAVDWTLR